MVHGVAWGAEALPDSGDTGVDRVHGELSERVTATAEWLDSFFADDNYELEANKTRLRLSLSSFTESGEGTDFKARAGLRLRLPRFENRLLLVVSGATEDFDTTDSDWEETEDDFTGADEDNLAVGLKYYFRQAAKNNLSLSGGLRFRSGTPVAYVKPRYRHSWTRAPWDMRFVQEIGWYSDSGFDSRSEFQVERPLDHRWFFRTTARVDWYDDEDGVFPQLRFDWRRALSANRAVSVQWNNYFETAPDAVLDSSVLKVRYRQQTWRSWLWFEVAPQITFAREDDYDASLGILLKLEADFQRVR